MDFFYFYDFIIREDRNVLFIMGIYKIIILEKDFFLLLFRLLIFKGNFFNKFYNKIYFDIFLEVYL